VDGVPANTRRNRHVRGEQMTPKDFFAGVRKGVKAALPPELRQFDLGRGHSRLLKIHYSHPEVHFEAWHHTGDGRLEIGLHFEGTAGFNDRAFNHFRSRMVEVKALLPRAELEPWDRGWCRLYETLPAPQLEASVMEPAIELMAHYISGLEPMVDRFMED
jgi:hypothetical protein